MKNLAIIIPAYKFDFFEDTIKSLAQQSNKNFTLYVGDDGTTHPFENICKYYSQYIDIVYHHFENNIGSLDLVGQWTRCIDLTNGEPWLWLFSDDDIIGPDCVDLFYHEISSSSKFDLYHFNVKVIDNESDIVSTPRVFPSLLCAHDFYKKKEFGKIQSFVIEYVFSRKIYEKVEGFENFDLAWGSDTATWIKMGFEKGISTINGGYVFWRKSNFNITPKETYELCKRKFKANVEYLNWSNSFFCKHSIGLFNYLLFFKYFYVYSHKLLCSDILNISSNFKVPLFMHFILKCLIILSYPVFSIFRRIHKCFAIYRFQRLFN